jgi:uncharacterized membrane protein YdbT with pleckstrin-like domain
MQCTREGELIVNTQERPSRSLDESAMNRIAGKLENLLKAFVLKVGHYSQNDARIQLGCEVIVFFFLFFLQILRIIFLFSNLIKIILIN